MADDETGYDAPKARSSTQEQRVILVQSLAVTWDVLDHLEEKGVITEQPSLRARANCCKPDGGTCCVNKQTVAEEVRR